MTHPVKPWDGTDDNMLAVFAVHVIRQQLARDGRTQADLAAAAGITQKHLSQMLRGRKPGSVQLWGVLLREAGVDIIAPAWALGAHVRAMAQLLVRTGDMTPMGRQQFDNVVRQHLPGVTWEGDDNA